MLTFVVLLTSFLASCGGFRLASCGSSVELSGFTCMFTPLSVHCPANWYCPLYESNQVSTYYPALVEAGCVAGEGVIKVTGNSSYTVLCPCTPGFYCPENTELPVFCPEGSYCPPSNDTVTPLGATIGASGLGAFGSLVYQCPKGTWCPYGQVVPFECNKALSDCPAGSSEPEKTKNWVLMGFILFAIFLCFQVSEYIALRERRLQDLSLESNKAEIAAAVAEMQAGGNARSGGGVGNSTAGSINSGGGGLLDALKTPFSRSPLINEAAEAESGYRMMDTTLHTDSSSFSRAETPSFLITFENLGLTLPTGVSVMSNVHGSFQKGRLCAIMGPSGAGKTTVINLITGKVKRSCGRVLVNGCEVDGLSQIAKLVGFVPQEDVMLRELTVRDNISFSAKYRLPAVWSGPAVEAKINDCIAELGISHVQHSIIGDERTRGISGGQRKRVNIGIELVADPSILFLDEPTSGLDSTTSTSLCATLKRIAQARAMTIAAVIHQPSLSSFLMFDDLLLLGKGGRVVYHGPVADATAYFASLGFPLPPNTNPADFYLDVAQGAVDREVDEGGAKVRQRFDWMELFDLWEEHRQGQGQGQGGGEGEGGAQGQEQEQKQGHATQPSSPSPSARLPTYSDVIAGSGKRVSESSTNSRSDSSHSLVVRQSSVSAMCRRDLLSADAQLESTKSTGSMLSNAPAIASSMWHDAVHASGKYCSSLLDDAKEAIGLSSTGHAIAGVTAPVASGHAPQAQLNLTAYSRVTPSAMQQFVLCLTRSLKQIFAGFRPFVSEMALHLVCGAVISTAANRLYFEGPLPNPVCAIQTFSLQGLCVLPQAAQYVQIGNFMCFGILFAAIAASSATFGNEQVNYWRECSAGLNSAPYFFGRWISNFPRIALSALFFFFSFSIKFSNTGSTMGLYHIILMVYWFGYSLGYVVSQLVPIKHAPLLGVVLALIFAVGFAGANPNMNQVREKSKAVQWVWALSGPRWALEAFYVNSIRYYQNIPSSKYNSLYVGQPYQNVEQGLDAVGYDIGNYRQDLVGLLLDGIGWSLFALFLMVVTHRDKKR